MQDTGIGADEILGRRREKRMKVGKFISDAKKLAVIAFRRRVARINNRPLSDGIRYFFVTGFTLAAVAAFILSKFESVVISFISAVDKNGKPLDAVIKVDFLFVAVFVFGWFLLLFSLIVVAQLASANNARNKKLLQGARQSIIRKRKYLQDLRFSYDAIGRAAERINDQVNGNPAGVRYDYKRISTKYLVHPNGDTSVEKEITFIAKRSVFSWVFFVDASPHGESQLLHRDIDFQLSPMDEYGCAFIPMRDSLLRKSFMVAFLPFMRTNEERKIRLSYSWPKFLAGLAKNGEDEIFWDNKGFTKSATTEFRAEFIFISRSTASIAAQNTGPRPNDLSLTIQVRDNDKIVVYESKKMPVGQYRLALSAK